MSEQHALPPGWWRSNFGSISSGNFQRQVFPQPAPGVEGDFCDHNPRASVNAGPGGLVAGPQGIIVGRFAWISPSFIDPNNAPAIANSYSNGGPVTGFVHREQQGLITNWLGGTSMHVPGGFPVTLHQAGGFFVINRGENYAHLDMQAFARLSDGAVMFDRRGANPGAATITGSVAPQTVTAVGSILGNVMTITEVSDGVIVPGTLIEGDGVYPGTRVVAQLTGPTYLERRDGGIGTYALSIASQHVETGTAITGTYGELTVTDISGAAVQNGSMLGTGTAGEPSVFVTHFLTGTGNVGTYAVSGTEIAAPTELTNAIETKWFATSAGNPGELIKMSSWPLG